MVGIVGLFLLVLIVRLITSDSSKDKATNTTSAEQQLLPTDEREFISTVNDFKARYEQAPNEFQKSNLRTERAAALVKVLPNLSVSDWVGEVSEMRTTHDDRWGVLSVKIGNDKSITVTTQVTNVFNNRTLIPPGSDLYNQVSHLAIGRNLTFTGTFEPGTSDYAEEVSVTEKGAMTDPAFLFTFTSIGRGVVPPKAKSAWSEEPKPDSGPKAEPIQPTPPEPIAPVVPSEPTPSPPVVAGKLTSGVLCNGTVAVAQNGELTFKNLPGDRLKFAFDHDAWQATIHREPDGTQTLVMRSIKSGIQTRCDMRWETSQ